MVFVVYNPKEEDKVAMGVTSPFWEMLDNDERRRYLQKHPRSKFGGYRPGHKGKKKRPKKTADAPAPAPKKDPKDPAKVTLKQDNFKALGPAEQKETLQNAADNLRDSDQFKAVDAALAQPVKKIKPSKIKKAATAIREAIKSEEAKELAVAMARTIILMGGTALIAGAALGVGIDAGLFLPQLLRHSWQSIKPDENDHAIVKSLVDNMRKRMSEPFTGAELADAMVDTPSNPNGQSKK